MATPHSIREYLLGQSKTQTRTVTRQLRVPTKAVMVNYHIAIMKIMGYLSVSLDKMGLDEMGRHLTVELHLVIFY